MATEAAFEDLGRDERFRKAGWLAVHGNHLPDLASGKANLENRPFILPSRGRGLFSERSHGGSLYPVVGRIDRPQILTISLSLSVRAVAGEAHEREIKGRPCTVLLRLAAACCGHEPLLFADPTKRHQELQDGHAFFLVDAAAVAVDHDAPVLHCEREQATNCWSSL